MSIRLTIEEAKANFFDRMKVTDAFEKARRKNLSKLGAFIRQRAKTSIRKRKAVSEKGSPPSSHVGYLRDFMFFAFDPATETVVVGPAVLSGRNSTLDALEYGGSAMITRKRHGKELTLQAQFAARPFMRPALEKEKARSAKLWENTIR